ncbi:LysR substrate-binding domain-containing protein, partial [Puniceibacterium antarcticum]
HGRRTRGHQINRRTSNLNPSTSQPSISRAIRQMEDATSLRLFDRAKGGLIPTAAAHELAITIDEAFRGISEIRRAAEAIRKRETMQIRVGCLPAFSHGFLARAVSDFVTQNPSVSVSIQSLLSKDMHEAVHKRQIDVGIAAYEIDDPNLSIHRFTTLNEIVLVPNSHPLAQKRMITPGDLAGERLILLSKLDPYRSRLENVLDTESVQPLGLVEVETSAGACSLVASGLGVSVVNPVTALEYLHLGLTMRTFTHDLPFVTTLVSAKSRQQPKHVKIFEKVLIANLMEAKVIIDHCLSYPSPLPEL